MNRCLLLIALALPLGACRTTAPQNPTSGAAAVTLERTACMGSCPVYTLTLYADGSVRFEGRNFVKKKGVFTKRVSPSAVAAIFDQVEKIGFWNLPMSYAGLKEVATKDDTVVQLPPTDLPTCYVTVKSGARTKRIEDYWGAPAQLHELERLIDLTGGAAEWVGYPTQENEESRKTSELKTPHRQGSL